MLRFSKLCTFIVLFELVFVGAAWSCLNDQELPQREREFRSDYQIVDSSQPEAPAIQHFEDSRMLAVGGVVLLLGSMGLLYFSFRNQS